MQTVAPPGNSTRIVVAVSARLTRNRAEPIGRINNYGGYAFHRQRPMIQTKLVIIATTLNTIRYSIFTSFFALVMKSEPALSSGPRVHYSLDTDVPSDRNCSQRELHSHAGPRRQT
jgi:hypothetical protein